MLYAFKKYIPISSRVDSLSNDMTYNIHINNSELKKVTHTKFLGVIIDENLTWKQHIKALSRKLASCTGSLNRIIQFLPKNMHKELYYCLSLSTGGNEAVQARASFSSSGKHPKSLKHHFNGCKYSYNF